MLDEFDDWIALALHSTIVGLHIKEFAHVNVISITVLIGVGYMAISSLEVIHLRRKIKTHHKKVKE